MQQSKKYSRFILSVIDAKESNGQTELGKVLDFYRENPHEFMLERSPISLLYSAQRRSLYSIENEEGKIVGASANFLLPNETQIEAGATRVIHNGFRFQSIFLWVRLLEVWFMGEIKSYYTVSANRNTTSIRHIKESGFDDWIPDPQNLAMIQKYKDEELDDNYSFFQLQEDKIESVAKKAARKLLSIFDSPILKSTDNRSCIALYLNTPLFRSRGNIELLRKFIELPD